MVMSEANVLVVDVETTGTDPETDRIVEIAVAPCCISQPGSNADQNGDWSALCDPGMPIPPQAMAIHHIRDEDVVGKPTPQQVVDEMVDRYGSHDGPLVFVAHNAEFDRAFIEPLLHGREAVWICTRRLAMHTWPEAPGTSNQLLRYWLDLDVDTGALAPHRALADAQVTRAIFRAIEEESREGGLAGLPSPLLQMTAEEVAAAASAPAELQTMPFGKHRGTPFADIPLDYLMWMKRQRDMDPDALLSASREYERRMQKACNPAASREGRP